MNCRVFLFKTSPDVIPLCSLLQMHISRSIFRSGGTGGGDLGPTEARSFFWKGDFRDDLGL